MSPFTVFQNMQTNSYLEKADQWLPGKGMGDRERGTSKLLRRLDCADGFTHIHHLLYANYTSIRLFFIKMKRQP